MHSSSRLLLVVMLVGSLVAGLPFAVLAQRDAELLRPAAPFGLETGSLSESEKANLREPVVLEAQAVHDVAPDDAFGPKNPGAIDPQSTWQTSDSEEGPDSGFQEQLNSGVDAQHLDSHEGPPPAELAFVGGVKRPARGLDTRIREHVEAAGRAGAQKSGDAVYAFLILDRKLTPERTGEAEALGVVLVAPHSRRVWKVRVPLASVEAVAALQWVHWLGWADRSQKLDPVLQDKMASAPYSGERTLFYVNVMDEDTSPGAFTEIETIDGVGHKRYHPAGRMEQALKEAGFEVLRFDRALMMFTTRGSYAAVQRVLDEDWVLFVEPDRPHRVHMDQSSPLVESDELWNGTYTGAGVSVGIIDSGSEVGAGRHTDLDRMAACGVNYTPTGSAFTDELGHGTHVSGIMAGNGACNAGKYHGQAPDIGTGTHRFRIAKCFNLTTSYSLADALDWMAIADPGSCTNTDPADIVNCSWGSDCYSTAPVGTDANSRKADEQVFQDQMVLVFSAGNGRDTPTCDDATDYWGAGSITTPAAAKNVITVGGCYDEDQNVVGDRYDKSSQGPTGDGRAKPDLNAPGCDNEARTGNNIYAPDNASACDMGAKCGTSMAAPHVTGIGATVMEHYPYLKGDPSRLKAWLMSRSIPHNNSLAESRNAYGAGRVDAYVAHYDHASANGWDGGSFHGTVDNNTWLYSDVTVPSDTDRMIIVLAWDETPASAGAASSVLYDLDLYADQAPFSASGNVGTYASVSSVDNVEVIRVNNPLTGSFRIKVFNADAPASGLHADVSYFFIRGDTSPVQTIALTTTDDTVRPGASFNLTATAATSAWVGSCGHAQLNALPSGVTVTGLDAVREDLTNYNYTATTDDNDIADLTLGNTHVGDSRSCTWQFASTTEGAKTISVTYDTDNGGSVTDTQVFTVDGVAPGLPTFLSSLPPASTWSNDNTVFVDWSPATDDRSGVDGYGEFWTTSPTSPPGNSKDREETVTSVTSSALADGLWYYRLKTVDNSGNWTSGFAQAGPFWIDTTEPGLVTGLHSTSHSVGGWSYDNTIDFAWTAATDNLSGIDGYGILQSTGTGAPTAVKNLEEVTAHTTASIPTGTWYFAVRSVDNAGNWDVESVTVGPYGIDRTLPVAPSVVTSGSHVPGGYSNDPAIDIGWAAGSDAHSGLAGYSWEWTQSSGSIPDNVADGDVTSTTSPSLADGDWWFHALSVDIVGNASGTVHAGPYRIDATAPTNPVVMSTSHPAGFCSSDCTIDLSWSGASGSPPVLQKLGPQAGSGITGYSIELTQLPGTTPDLMVDTTAPPYTSACLTTGEWWFHLRTKDAVGNWSSPMHYGPMNVDAVPPVRPNVLTSGSHSAGAWSGDPTVDYNWSGASDVGCGVLGYSLLVSTSPTDLPDGSIETTGSAAATAALTGGQGWHLHVRTVDAAGLASPDAAHFGPLWIDSTAPVSLVTYPNGGEIIPAGSSANVTFTASDTTSGVQNVRVELSTDGGTTFPAMLYDGPDPVGSVSWTVPPLNASSAVIRVRVLDRAGNAADDASDAPFAISSPDAVPGEQGSPVPPAFALWPGVPNPLRTAATITFDLHEARGVTIDVSDVTGRHVRTLISAAMPAGRHRISWDGQDAAGRPVGTGMYFARLTAGAFHARQTLTVVR